MAKHHWASTKCELMVSASHDFERKCLPLLKIKWPALVHPKTLKYLDRSGIDHVWLSDGSPLGAVIQCKGFEVEEPLGDSQIKQIRDSIETFIKSRYTCEHYVLLHNREGRDREFAKAIQLELKKLVDSKKSKVAELWDIDRLINELNSELSVRLLNQVRKRAESAKNSQQAKFLFGSVFIGDVPCRMGTLKPQLHGTPQMKWDRDSEVTDPLTGVAQFITRRSWTLIVGTFGSGKSLLALRLGLLKEREVIYVPASELRHAEIGSHSENSLMRMIVQYINIFDEDADFSDSERESLRKLAGPLLAARLRDQDNQFVLVIDGLDENRVYSSSHGLQLLTNELGRASCPIILTVRKEQFFDQFLLFSDQLIERGKFRSTDDQIRIVELNEWGHDQVLSYIDAAITTLSGEENIGLTEFRSMVSSGVLSGRFFLEHPLLLAMTVDLVAEKGSTVTLNNCASLYEQWIFRKLVRDFSIDRLIPVGFENSGLVIQKTVALMVAVANAMVSKEDNGYELLESIDEVTVRRLASDQFEGAIVPTALYSTTSLLEPIRQRGSTGFELKFFHRSFHEYFLACALVGCGQGAQGYPVSVQAFYKEIIDSTS